MSREALLEARDLIKAKRYDEARFILKSIDHPTAVEWLAKLDQIAPVAPQVEDNPFDSPFDDPFAPSMQQTPRPAPPKPQPTPPPTPEVWVNDRTFGKPASTKKNDPQISNGVMILAVGGMLMVGAIILGIIVILTGGGKDDKKSASNDGPPTSIFNFSNEDVFALDMITRGEMHYGDVRDDVVANDTGHIWTFQGVQGEHIDIAIQSTWDNVLQLKDADGHLIRENDDQSGDFAGDARLYDITLPHTGGYQIVVKPWGFIGGSYRLWLTQIQ